MPNSTCAAARKSAGTQLINALRSAANLITPDADGNVPVATNSAAMAQLGYRIGRALSLARKVVGRKSPTQGCQGARARQ